MAKVDITVNGRQFAVGCEPGEESRLKELAALFDGQVSRLANHVGQIGDLRLFLMAGLVLADELDEAKSAAPASAGDEGESEARAAAALNRVAERLERLAALSDTAT